MPDRYTAADRKHAVSVAAAAEQHRREIAEARDALRKAWGIPDDTEHIHQQPPEDAS